MTGKPSRTTEQVAVDIEREVAEAAYRALDSLARYKFMQFGYWAAIYVHLVRIAGGNRPNPFRELVRKARDLVGLIEHEIT